MLAGKKLTDYTSLFSPHAFTKNDDIILSYLKNEWKQFPWSKWQNNFIWTNKTSTKWKIIRIENYLYQSLNLLIKENHAVEN